MEMRIVRVALVTLPFVVIALMGPIMTIAKTPAPGAGDLMLVIAQDATKVVLTAGGQLIGPTQAPLAALATGDEGLTARLYASGAWVVADGQWLAQICGVREL